MTTIPPDLQTKIDAAASSLSEHFDSVRIFVTAHDGGNAETQSCDSGYGNLYAQLGQIREWLIFQDTYARVYAENHGATDET